MIETILFFVLLVVGVGFIATKKMTVGVIALLGAGYFSLGMAAFLFWGMG